jgi:hypothetical protein
MPASVTSFSGVNENADAANNADVEAVVNLIINYQNQLLIFF